MKNFDRLKTDSNLSTEDLRGFMIALVHMVEDLSEARDKKAESDAQSFKPAKR